MFSESIAENIRFGAENPSPQEIEAAAKVAFVHHNIVEFDQGYDTILGERGITLSGGQKQRVSMPEHHQRSKNIVARRLFGVADTETEEAILTNLNTAKAKLQ